MRAESKTPFIITIDAEGDNLWARPQEVTTRNAEYLPRFQTLCERYHFKPVYLATYEMAMCDFFVEFVRDVVERGAGEIGMHLHAWNSPPLEPLTEDDFLFQPFLIEYPTQVMKQKIRVLTRLLEERFGRAIISHRAGRWAFDDRYAAVLAREGYRVDCSVTPGVDWRATLGDPGGKGGPDYTAFASRPYLFNPSDGSPPLSGSMLEVPMTIRPSELKGTSQMTKEAIRRLTRALCSAIPWSPRNALLRHAANRLSPKLSWLYPAESSLNSMLEAAREARAESAPHLEFMLHSSELMPGGSPVFPAASDIERLYQNLEVLFEILSAWCYGETLQGLYARLTTTTGAAESNDAGTVRGPFRSSSSHGQNPAREVGPDMWCALS